MSLAIGINSYIDEAEATSYFGDRLYAEDWMGATSDDRRKALLMARRTIDQQAFLGDRSNPDQLLAWPRCGVHGVASGTVPQGVKEAQLELALALLRKDLTAENPKHGIRRAQAGPVSIEYDGGVQEKVLPKAVLGALRPFLISEGGLGYGNSLPIVL